MEDEVNKVANKYLDTLTNIGVVLDKDIIVVLYYVFLKDYMEHFKHRLTKDKIRDIMDIFDCLEKYSCFAEPVNLSDEETLNKYFYDNFDGGLINDIEDSNSFSLIGQNL